MNNAAEKHKAKSYWAVGYAILALMIGTNMPSPLYQVYMQKWGFTPGTLTAIFACYAFFLIPSLVVFGRMTDRIGRKSIIVIGLLLAAFGTLFFAFAQDVFMLFVGRAIQGIAVGAVSVAATAALMELHPTENRRNAALVTTLATAGGTAVGPLLSGGIAEFTGHALDIPFYLELFLLVPAIFAVALIPSSLDKKSPSSTAAQSSEKSQLVIDSTLFALASAAAFVAWSVAALFMSLMPSYVSQLLGIHSLLIGGGTIFAMLAASIVAQIGLRGIVPSRNILSGLVFLSVGLCAVVFSVIAHSFVLLEIGTALCGLGHGMVFVGATVMVNILVSPANRGRALSIYYIVIYLGVGLPILLIGLLASRTDLRFAVSVFTAAILFISVLLGILIFKRMDRIKALIHG